MSNCHVKRYKFILEGHECKADITPAYIKAFLLDLTKRIGMNLLPMGRGQDNPRAVYVHPDSGKEPGCTGDVMWMESGCQVHTWEKYGYVDLWMFSCRDYKFTEVETLFKYWFKPKTIRNCIPIVSERTQ